MLQNDLFTTIIEIPPFLTTWDLEKVLSKILRKIVEPDKTYVIDMENVVNVYSATIQLILRIYDRTTRLACPVFIVNANEAVYNALSYGGILDKIPVCRDVEQNVTTV